MKFSHRHGVLAAAALLFGLLGTLGWTGPADAKDKFVSITHSPAKYDGRAKCESKYGAFKDGKGRKWEAASLSVLRGECWSCPSDAPRRTLLPVTGKSACERPAYTRYRKAIGPHEPKGKLVKATCDKGWFLNIKSGKCYSCRGYRRTLHPIGDRRACSTRVKAQHASALRRGRAGCPGRSFRNGLSDKCYSCPRGYGRTLVPGGDLTKLGNACARVAITPPRLRLKPPKGLAARALREIRPYSDLIVQAVLSLPRAQKALLSGVNPKRYRDKALTDAIYRFNKNARRRAEAAPRIRLASAAGIAPETAAQLAALRLPTITHWSLGAVGDGTSPFLIGGNGSAEMVWRTGRALPIGLMLGVSVTVGAGGPGGDGSAYVGFYTVSEDQLKGFSWSVEVGYKTAMPEAAAATPAGVLPIALPPGKAPNGLDIQAVFLFDNDNGKKGPKFAGLIVGVGKGSPGVEADVGVNFSALIK